MLSVATQSSEPPYFAVTAGPASHSPPPMADAPITSPGPSIVRIFLHLKTGASIHSPVSQRGISSEPGCGATTFVAEAMRRAFLTQREGCRQVAHHRV